MVYYLTCRDRRLTGSTFLTRWILGTRIGVVWALNRHVEPVFNPDRKDHHWGKRKLKRDQWPCEYDDAKAEGRFWIDCGLSPSHGDEVCCTTQRRASCCFACHSPVDYGGARYYRPWVDQDLHTGNCNGAATDRGFWEPVWRARLVQTWALRSALSIIASRNGVAVMLATALSNLPNRPQRKNRIDFSWEPANAREISSNNLALLIGSGRFDRWRVSRWR